MPNCAVATCKNSNRSVKTAGKGIIFHCFPKNESKRKLWHQKCRRLDKVNFENATVCSEHFTEGDYHRDLQSELLGLPSKKKLKENAVPSLKLCDVNNITKDVSPSKLVHGVNQAKTKPLHFRGKVCNLSLASIALSSKTVVNNQNNTTKNKQPEKNNKDDVLELKELVHTALGTLSEEYTSDKQTSTEPCCILNTSELKKLENQFNYFRSRSQRLEEAVSQLKCRNRQLRQTICDQRNLLKVGKRKFAAQVKKEVHEILGRIFSKKQIQHLLKKRSRTNWDEEDIIKALVLIETSKKCYFYLRNKLGIPLPSLTVLKKWKSNNKSTVNMELLAITACQDEDLEVLEQD